MFPPVELADDDGFLCYGGRLTPAVLREAYASGIFPWPVEGQPLFWFSPPQRAVLFLDEVRFSSRLRRALRSCHFEVRHDTCFAEVMEACAQPRSERDAEVDASGTWITAAMKVAYAQLHASGEAHSVETFCDGELVGGLYGVSWGRYFCGESMFFRRSNASKAAVVGLVDLLRERGFTWLDCQVMSPHFAALGAREIPRATFLEMLKSALSWTHD